MSVPRPGTRCRDFGDGTHHAGCAARGSTLPSIPPKEPGRGTSLSPGAQRVLTRLRCLQNQIPLLAQVLSYVVLANNRPQCGVGGHKVFLLRVLLRGKLYHKLTFSWARMGAQNVLTGHGWSLTAPKGPPAFPLCQTLSTSSVTSLVFAAWPKLKQFWLQKEWCGRTLFCARHLKSKIMNKMIRMCIGQAKKAKQG